MSNLREGNGIPLQYSCLENPMDGGAWKAAVLGVAEGRTWLSDFTFTFHFHALEKEMATHSSVLAWRIPGTGEPGRLLSMGLHRVRHDWSDLAAAMSNLWTRSIQWHPTSIPVSCNHIFSFLAALKTMWISISISPFLDKYIYFFNLAFSLILEITPW